jgi:hypothetical protein
MTMPLNVDDMQVTAASDFLLPSDARKVTAVMPIRLRN